MNRAMALQQLELRRGIRSLAVIAYTAPLVGLMGTCLGIIGSFKGFCGEKESILFGMVFDLGEALWPLVGGLALAVLASWAHDYLSGCVRVFVAEMANAASEMLDFWGRAQRG